jgi:ubiquinone/menaquinone biosynthesis C-methylase UbiE
MVALQPRSLIGVDLSPAMLKRAAKAVGQNARLVESDCLKTPLNANSADWVLASFLLSYLGDLNSLARETARIARPDALVVFSDVHPATRGYGWRRTFRCAKEVIEIQTCAYQIDDLHKAMHSTDLDLESFDEYCFGDEEKDIFSHAGRPDLYEMVKDVPVLWIASYRKRCR